MTKVLWMTIDRHPDSLKTLIRGQLEATGWEVFEVSYDSIESMKSVPLEQIAPPVSAVSRKGEVTVPVQHSSAVGSLRAH